MQTREQLEAGLQLVGSFGLSRVALMEKNVVGTVKFKLPGWAEFGVLVRLET